MFERKLFLSVWLGLVAMANAAPAAPSSCASIYREAYIEFIKTDKPALKEFADLYLVYVDQSEKIALVFDEAAPLFESLKTPPAQRPAVLEQFSALMEKGEFCPSGRPLNIKQVSGILLNWSTSLHENPDKAE